MSSSMRPTGMACCASYELFESAWIAIESPIIDITAKAKLATHSDGLANHTSSGPMTIKGAIVLIN